MTVSSNYNAYSSYSSYGTSSSQRQGPNFEKMANDLLSSLDTDSSGTIDASEFTTAVGNSSSDSSTSASDIFNTLDTNSDGSLSSQELMSALQNMQPPPPPPQGQGQNGEMPPPPPDGTPPPPPPSDASSSSSSNSASSLSDIFSSLDTNQDGSISQDELAALFSDTTNSSSSTSSTEQANTKDKKMIDNLLQRIISSYGSDSALNSTTSSALNLSA